MENNQINDGRPVATFSVRSQRLSFSGFRPRFKTCMHGRHGAVYERLVRAPKFPKEKLKVVDQIGYDDITQITVSI